MRDKTNQLLQVEVERKLLELCANILFKDHESIMITDDFFTIGGDSILAMKLVTKISQEFSVTLPLKILFLSNSLVEVSKNIIQLSEN
jgi:acyl carrier protein